VVDEIGTQGEASAVRASDVEYLGIPKLQLQFTIKYGKKNALYINNNGIDIN
jgi:hypothetical protein